jgi:hypothetical protein
LGDFFYLGQSFENYRNSPKFLATFLAVRVAKNGLGYILGDFFTNSKILKITEVFVLVSVSTVNCIDQF